MRSTLVISLVVLLTACLGPTPPPKRQFTYDALVARGDCAVATGSGTQHTSNITADETWTAAGSPHVVSSLRIEATVTVEACAVVQLKKEAVITVGNSAPTGKAGKLIAAGTFDDVTLKPVLFLPENANERWTSLFVQQTGAIDLSYTALVGGGNRQASSTNAAIEARGSQEKPRQQLVRVKRVAVRDSGTQGITLKGYASFTTDSEGLQISGSGAETELDARFLTGFPLDLQPGCLSTIPPNSELKGNRRDFIYVRSVTRLAIDEAFVNRGLPYIINGDFLMYDLDRAPLTLGIEAGVTLRFEKQGSGNLGLTLGNKSSGATVKIEARGTAANPIVLTSAQASPAVEDWRGVYLANGPEQGNVFEYVTIEYAGGVTGARGFGCGPLSNIGGLQIIEWRPADAFVKNSTFRNLRGAGIVSGWNSDAAGPDLSASNTFSDIAEVPMEGRCNVTRWAPASGVGSCSSRPLCVN